LKFELEQKEALTILSNLSEAKELDLHSKLLTQYREQNPEVALKYHTINSTDITYFEYNPLYSTTVLSQGQTRQWLPNFADPKCVSEGKTNMASLNGMLFSYINPITRVATKESFACGTCMNNGIWHNKPYDSYEMVNMICKDNKLIVQDGVKIDEYPKADFIISGHACMKNGEFDTTRNSRIPTRNQITNRTIFGQKSNGNFVMITMKLAKIEDCKRLCKALDVVNAITLDGGGSTRFNLFDKTMNVNGKREIANAILVYSKLTKEDTEYPGRQFITF